MPIGRLDKFIVTSIFFILYSYFTRFWTILKYFASRKNLQKEIYINYMVVFVTLSKLLRSRMKFSLMRRLGLFVLIGGTLLIAPIAHAAQFKTGDHVSIPSDQTINEDVYIATGNATVDGTINGDLFIAGGTIAVNGPVSGGVFVAGGTITLNGP